MVTMTILEARLGSLDAVKVEMESATKGELSARHGVPVDTVGHWERQLGYRCMRRCSACGAVKPYALMYLDSLGRTTSITKCRPCGENGRRVRQAGQRLVQQSDDPEFLSIPQAFFELTMRPIAPESEGRLNYWGQP
jgi:hypothetical protein